MIITDLRTNHLENPLGYALDNPVLTWTVREAAGSFQESARISISLTEDFKCLYYDSKRRIDISSLGFTPDITLKAQTRYYWKVQVWGDDGEEGESEAAWFETGLKDWTSGKWITSPLSNEQHPIFHKKFSIEKEITSARIYITGLGAYTFRINGSETQDELLAPFYNDYNNWVQYQTYDVTGSLKKGENVLSVLLGNGWYKGRFGFIDRMDKLYGKEFLLLCELHVRLRDGSELILGTDTDWLCGASPVMESSIYDGEVYDSRKEEGWKEASLPFDSSFLSLPKAVAAAAPAGKLMPRLSPALTVMERLTPVSLIHTPAKEQVIDFRQEVTGYVEFTCSLKEGEQITLQYGEILQQGNFYNENLRTAKQEYTYISDGKTKTVKPLFTFYGFRYVKIIGPEAIKLSDFTACVVYSKLKRTGEITTSNDKLNRLFLNTLWGMKGNFLDVPTDCPQRDERMGWTGDAQAFSATASFHMYTPAFYRKYLYDMLLEQRELEGSVPHVVPDILTQIMKITGQEENIQHGSCAWGDAAAVIPWNLYLYYGDKKLLNEQYENMKLWVDFIKEQEETRCGGRRLWQCGFHFADWLALDNTDKSSSFGGTDPYYIASAYYYYSTCLLSKAADVLGKAEDAACYAVLAEEIKEAIRKEYFTQEGRLTISTQTAMVLALHWNLVPEEHRKAVTEDLIDKLRESNLHLTTGFVGTQYLCPALSENGSAYYAYTLLLNEDYPSWLYEVNMGATTIWERWNSVLPDGQISDTGMNSLNHYTYGSIAEWMYRYMCGIQPLEAYPGFKQVRIAPQPDERIGWVKASYDSASGLYESGWEFKGEEVVFTVSVPFDAKAKFLLPEGYEFLERDERGFILTCGKYTLRAKKQQKPAK